MPFSCQNGRFWPSCRLSVTGLRGQGISFLKKINLPHSSIRCSVWCPILSCFGTFWRGKLIENCAMPSMQFIDCQKIMSYQIWQFWKVVKSYFFFNLNKTTINSSSTYMSQFFSKRTFNNTKRLPIASAQNTSFFQKKRFYTEGPRLLELTFFDVSTSCKTSNFFLIIFKSSTILAGMRGADHSIFVKIY